MDKEKNLFAEFEGISDSDWRQKVIQDLKGKDFEETLIWKDEDGIEHLPYYRASSIEDNKLIKTIQSAQRKNKSWELLEVNPSPFDPIGDHLFRGKEIEEVDSSKKYTVSGLEYKKQGASASQEVAFMLQHAVEYFDSLTETNSKESLKEVDFNIAVGNSYFVEIAKFRAFRFLIKRIYSSYGVEIEPRITGIGSKYYLSHLDMHTNLLRLTTQGMSAILGGADALYLPSFDCPEKPSLFGNRMSRNIQLILKNEAHFDKVIDATSGSYYIENLTSGIANKAWSLFNEIESVGGLIPYVDSGTYNKEVNNTKESREELYKKGERVLVGVNKFKNSKGLNAKNSSTHSLSNKVES